MPIAKSFLFETTEFDLQTRLLSKWKSWFEVAGVTGLEPAASGVTGQRSNQLSYTPDPMFTGEVGTHERAIVYVRT